MTAELTADQLIDTHRPTLDQALEAIRTRAYWSPHPEHPKAYGEERRPADVAAGQAAFEALRGTRLDAGPARHRRLDGRRESRRTAPSWASSTRTPDLDVLLPAMRAGHARLAGRRPARRAPWSAWRSWPGSAPARIEFAHAVMHTTGQAFMMAFQAGGPHAQDRGLEAVAYALRGADPHARRGRLDQAAGQARPAGADARPSPRSRAASRW